MQQSIYTVYVTTNIVNNKIYVGVHKTHVAHDDYLGSGNQIMRAIKKYGSNNFDKQVIAVFASAKPAYMLESMIVNQNFVDSDMTYNIKLGGHGGWDYIHQNKLTYKMPHDQRMKYVKLANIALKKKYPNGTFKNKIHSNNTKLIMSEKTKLHQKGSGNSQYGSFWITNGVDNAKCRGDIPDGWYKGRNCKNGPETRYRA